MKTRMLAIITATLFVSSCGSGADEPKGKLLQNVILIDGISNEAQQGVDILMVNDTIAEIAKGIAIEKAAEIIDFSGRIVMPALISTHVHVGTLKGTTTSGENYTRENILNQLAKYQQYGVLTVQSLGTDRPLLFENGLYDSLKNGMLPGARMFSSGYGFGADGGAPPPAFGMDKVFRPKSSVEVSSQLDTLIGLEVKLLKIWVDDMGRSAPKMTPEVYGAIISEAHKRKMQVASHLYYLADAYRLANDGVDVFAHSVRDSVVTDDLIAIMKQRRIFYVPTLTLDEFAIAYAEQPEWLNDPFFTASLEPGVAELVASPAFKDAQAKPASYERNKIGFANALSNVKKLYDAGIVVALGTDSGAQPVRAQGFAEHRELELLVEAGLTPMQALKVATYNSARLLGVEQHYGSIEKGKKADLIILDDNPLTDIKNTRTILSVYKDGIQVK